MPGCSIISRPPAPDCPGDFGCYGRSTFHPRCNRHLHCSSKSLFRTATQSMVTHHPLTKDEPMDDATQDPSSSAASVNSTTSLETSLGSTLVHSAGTVTVSAREHSRTTIARPRWDSTPTRRAEGMGSTSAGNSRPKTETEDGRDVDMDYDRTDASPERTGNTPQTSSHTR